MSGANPLNALLERRCASLRDEMESIQQKLSGLTAANGCCPELLKETISLVHTVNGSSGSLGFLALSSAAMKLEEALKDCAEADQAHCEVDVGHIRTLFSELQMVVQRTTPEDSRLYGVDLNQFGSLPR